MSEARETLTYEAFGTASRELAQHVADGPVLSLRRTGRTGSFN